MPLTPDERRRRERERKARYRKAQAAKTDIEALPRIGPGGRDDDGTDGPPPLSNYAAAKDFLDALTVPAHAKPRAALLLTLARDLDSDAIAQRSALAQRYDEVMEKLVAAAKPKERDELDELRRSFYSGGVSDIIDDPEARRKNA